MTGGVQPDPGGSKDVADRAFARDEKAWVDTGPGRGVGLIEVNEYIVGAGKMFRQAVTGGHAPTVLPPLASWCGSGRQVAPCWV